MELVKLSVAMVMASEAITFFRAVFRCRDVGRRAVNTLVTNPPACVHVCVRFEELQPLFVLEAYFNI